MNDSDKIKMYLNIGEQRVVVDATAAEEDFVREVEKKVGNLYRQLRIAFPNRANREVLAMVAYKFAWSYEELRAEIATARAEVADCMTAIDSVLDSTQKEEDLSMTPDPEK